MKRVLFDEIEGDYALCYYDYLNGLLILSRDMFGKRSLMMMVDKEGNLQISSTSILPDSEAYELRANSIMIINLMENPIFGDAV